MGWRLLTGHIRLRAIFFEFEEFSALFTLPPMVCATFIRWRYGLASTSWWRSDSAPPSPS
jgi:hypothetical protein